MSPSSPPAQTIEKTQEFRVEVIVALFTSCYFHPDDKPSVIALYEALEGMKSGTLLKVISDKPEAISNALHDCQSKLQEQFPWLVTHKVWLDEQVASIAHGGPENFAAVRTRIVEKFGPVHTLSRP